MTDLDVIREVVDRLWDFQGWLTKAQEKQALGTRLSVELNELCNHIYRIAMAADNRLRVEEQTALSKSGLRP